MIIKELRIQSFGKFKDKNIILKKGLNIIFGNNEAGKSTIHKFIEGMLFGFFKDQKSRRAYSEEYDKYFPRNNNEYKGILIYQEDDQEYRIERNFEKGKDIVVIYNNLTGEDVTTNFTYEKANRLFIPFKDKSLNRTIYKNTISISQLQSKTDVDLSKELKDKFVNMGKSMTEDISIKNSLDYLENKKKEIGTDRRKNTPLFEIDNLLKQLYEEQKSIKKNNIEIKNIQKNLKLIDEKMNLLVDKKSKLELNLTALESQVAFNKVENYNKLHEDNIELNKDLITLEKYKNLDDLNYELIISLKEKTNILRSNIKDINLEYENILLKLKHLQKTMNKNIIEKFKNIKYDYDKLQQLINRFNSMSYQNSSDNLFLIEDKYYSIKNALKRNKLIMIISLVSSFIIIPVAYFSDRKLYIIGAIFIVSSILLNIKYRNNLNTLNITEKKYNEIKTKNDELNRITDNIKYEIEKILKKYECKNNEEFLELYQDTTISFEESNEIIREHDILLLRKKEIENNVLNNEQKINNIESQINEILISNNIDNINDFKNLIKYKKQYEIIKTKYEKNKLLMNNIISDKEMKSIIAKSEKFKELKEYLELENREEIEKLLFEVDKDIRIMIKEKSSMEGMVNNLEVQYRTLSEVENEIIYNEKKLNKMKNKLESLDIAIKTIQEISESIHNDFAPELNRKVGEIINSITHKYKDIKITKDLEIKLEDPITNNLLLVDNLSGGTIDQIYFSFRVALFEFILENDMPLIIDDAFVQYDLERLENIMNFLLNLESKKQIIIFTCQKRELEILNKGNNIFNFINLEEELYESIQC